MIGFIKGTVISKASNYVIVDTGGVGYKIFYPNYSGEIEKEFSFFIYHHIREDSNDLYGFLSAKDLEIFELLIQVAGVGPKLGQTILQSLSRDKIISAISKNDATMFKTVSGVGSKVAAKIIVELKTKVTGVSTNLLPEEDETLDALVSLGYKKADMIDYISSIPSGMNSVQQKVKYILSCVGKKRS